MLERLNRDERLRRYVDQILTGEHIKFYPREHRRQAQLELMGVVKADAESFCIIRNRVYERVLTGVTEPTARSSTPQPSLHPELNDALTRRTLALFIGADLPREVTGLPSRADLARELARRKGLDESLSLAEVAQRVSQAGNRWEFTDFVRNALDTTGKSPQPFHRRIVELVKTHQIETIITTAYDNLLELAFQEESVGINRVVRGSDVSFINPDRPTLIKLYGDAQQPDTLVVTEDDHYGLWRDRDKEDLLDEVRNVLRKQMVLFLGYNLADPDFNLLWREVLDRAGRFARTAYAIWPGVPEGEVRMWRDRGIVILEADPWGLFPEGVCSDSAISVTKNGPGEVNESSIVGEKMTQKSYGFLGTEWDSNAELVDWQCSRCKGRFASKEEGIRHIYVEHGLGTLYPRLNTSGRLSLADLLSAAWGKTKREMLDILTHNEPSVLESMGFRAEVVEESRKAKDNSSTKGDGSAGGPAPEGCSESQVDVPTSESSVKGKDMDYELGLDALKRLAEGTDWYQDFTVHEAPLRENLRDERRYGPSEQTRRDRTRIVDQLNALALEHLGISFNDLCMGKQPPPQTQPPPDDREIIEQLRRIEDKIDQGRAEDRQAAAQILDAIDQNQVEQAEAAQMVAELRTWAQTVQQAGLPLNPELRAALDALAEHTGGVYQYCN
jgi:hypothetical protein